jgi:type I restriction-modification system DNA methylase subunit
VLSKPESKEMQPALYRRVSELLDKSRVEPNVSRSVWAKRLFQALDWGDRAAFSVEKDTHGCFNLTVEGCPVVSVVPEPPTEISGVYRAINRAYNKDIPWVVATDSRSLSLFGSYWYSFPHDITNALAWSIKVDELLLEAPKLNLLTPNEVARNELDQLYEVFPLRKKRHPIDVLLVERMSEWRGMAFEALGLAAAKNDSIVHRLINSLFLVRYIEDSGNPQETLYSLIGRTDAEIFKAILKSFREVRTQTNYPTLVQKELSRLKASPLKTLIRQLYGFEEWGVQYDFSAMSVDILGRFYEEYLRFMPSEKVLRPKKSQSTFSFERATHELQDVRREKGIFYTPQFLVQHIVSNLVRRYQAANAEQPPNIIDLACGSGTFLVAALHELEQRIIWRPAVAQHVVGLDSDPRAVEAARLNLVAKCLADKIADPIPNLKLLNYNLLTDGIDGPKLAKLIPDGVDIVVGNPPYIKYETLAKEYDVNSLRAKFNLATKRTDSYMLFIEAALRMVKAGGFCGLVLPNAFLRSSSGGHLRDWIANHADLLEIIDFQDQPVFQNVGVYVCVVLFRKRLPEQPSPKVAVAKVHQLSSTPTAQLAKLGVVEESDDTQEVFHIDQPTGAGAWVLRNSTEKALVEKISKLSVPLKKTDIKIRQGIKTGADDVFVIEHESTGAKAGPGSEIRRIEPETLIPFLRNRDMRRWHTKPKASLIYPYDVKTGKLIVWSKMLKNFPVCAAYLHSQKAGLSKRKSLHGEEWYELIRPRTDSVFASQPKLYIAELSLRPMICSVDDPRSAVAGSTGGGSWIVVEGNIFEPSSLMAFLNSCVAEWFLRQVASLRRGGWLLFEQQVLDNLPIPNFLTEPESFARSELSRLSSIAGKKMREAIGVQSSETRKQLNALEDQIDSLIIEALGLNAEEGTYIRRRVLSLRGAKDDKGIGLF